jgi:hypothetical protein
MKIRTVYFKSKDIQALCDFWSNVLEIKPHKNFEDWKEILCGTVRLGFLKRDTDTIYSNCVPVFEFEDHALDSYIKRALAYGAELLIDGRVDPKLLSAVMRDPFGNEFELSKFHD